MTELMGETREESATLLLERTPEAPPVTTRAERYRRYSRVDLTRIRVERTETAEDLRVVATLREAGFARVTGQDAGSVAWTDDTDLAPGVLNLVAYDREERPIGTMRVQDGRVAPLDLARFVPLDALLLGDDLPAVQFSRLSVVKAAQASEAMFGLFKAAWKWSFGQGLKSIVIATPPWSRPIYDFMFFEALGPRGEFAHEFAGGAQHVVMKLPVQSAEVVWRGGQHPLCTAFFDTEHVNLAI